MFNNHFKLPFLFSILTIIFTLISVAFSLLDDTPLWTHHTYLDPWDKYHLQWRFDYTKHEITFQVEVQTQGWIGFGLSPTGAMKGADIVTGWVESDGKIVFHVR
jgi:DOMON domain